jgi:hypothetical protein
MTGAIDTKPDEIVKNAAVETRILPLGLIRTAVIAGETETDGKMFKLRFS